MTFHIASNKEYKVGAIVEIKFSTGVGTSVARCKVLAQKPGNSGKGGRELVTAKYLYEMELVK